MIFDIALNKILTHCPIGVYPHEKTDGNDFETDIVLKVELQHTILQADDISGVINYAEVAAIAVEVLEYPFNLIETAAWRVAEAISLMPVPEGVRLLAVQVSLAKLNPPMDINIGSASASITLSL